MEEEITLLSDEEIEKSFTGDALSMYMKEITKYPRLSVSKQKELGYLYRDYKDEKAREELINCTLRLVVSIAYHYKHRINHLSILDLIEEGNLGLLRAAEDYNPDVGAFTTYATYWIKQKIIKGIDDTDNEIRKPIHIQAATRKYKTLISYYEKNRLPIPNDDEICDILDINIDTLKKIKNSVAQTLVSINSTLNEDKKTELENFLIIDNESFNNILADMTNLDLMIVIREILTPLQYYVIFYRYFAKDGKTLEEIGSYLKITRERVRQIEIIVLDKIKPYLNENSIDYLDILKKIKKREGSKFYKLNPKPIDPKDIIIYMYIKDNLTENEKTMYILSVWGKYCFTENDYSKLLKLPKEDIHNLFDTLRNKLNSININDYNIFEKQMIAAYGKTIFDIDLKKNPKIINYQELENKYSYCSLDEILSLVKEANYTLNSDEEKLIRQYFGSYEKYLISNREIEKSINILMFGYQRKNKHIPLKKLYEEYLNIKDKFTEEQQLFLECFIFNKKSKELFTHKYPSSSLRYHHYYLINILERSYYNILDYFDNNFNKDKWIEVKNKYNNLLEDKKILVLDLYYGVNEKPKTIKELSKIFNMPYNQTNNFCSDARDYAIRLYNGFNLKIDIDKNIYIPYIDNVDCSFTNETKLILSLFLKDNKSYDEIQNLTGLNKTRISNIITEGIRRIDFYRFKIIDNYIINENELNNFINKCNLLSDIDVKIIKLKIINKLNNDEIACILNKPKLEINKKIHRFYILFENYLCEDVSIDIEDIEDEIVKQKSESIWNDKEKLIASLYYGIKSNFNPKGLKLSSKEIANNIGCSLTAFYHYYKVMIKTLKSCKIGYKKPELSYISREKLDILLDDVHLPISDKEYDIICHLFELKGYSYMSLDDLAEKFQDTKQSIKRRYQRAIINIYKYLNKEIDGTIHYETDIEPLLKYFGNSDRSKIIDYYKYGMTIEELSIKYLFPTNQMYTTIIRIKNNIYDLMHNPNAKKFDFDYYREAIKNPNLPYDGDLDLAIKLFDLVFGMNGERVSIAEVANILKLDYVSTTVGRIISLLMISVCKLRDGITKDKSFTYDEILTYYLKNQDNMPDYLKEFYKKYFKTMKNRKSVNGEKIKLSYYIITDLIMDTYPNAFRLEKATKEEVLTILKKYQLSLNSRVKKELMARFEITEREFMNGKDINHVFKILYMIDCKKKELERTKLDKPILIKN